MIKFSKSFALYVLLLLLFGFRGEIFISLIFIILHELTHYFAARKLGFSAYEIKLLPFGAVLNLQDIDDAEPFEDFIISIAGPCMNIILALVFYFIYYKFKVNFCYRFCICNLVLGIFNLIPAFPLDGARILRDFLSLKMLYRRANKITLNVSVVIGCLLCFLYFLCFFKGYRGISIGLIALLVITTSLKERERVSYIIMGDIVKKKGKFIRRGYLENKSISIYYKSNLLKALELIDKNKYNVFLVLDEEMCVMDIIYEDEIIDALKKYGNITLEEFVEDESNIGNK
ncbi:M50 family metallopeptidase [Hathewaya limosa]|uniref:Stage IV sporulation protein FB n=1 Tax=Hathewaya limosa TaxID=1536 RepID=A0ABU0JQY5_HATLI|nr:M50 family metallopeptidase [Hathewaya limosa]MDQ0479508.1 stage IV sporulation protein FB [Hathewaya limosa]